MDCPTCGTTLATRQGMRQHHSKVHGESLPNRTCNGCDERFYDPKARRAYCDECNPNAGSNNGNWRGGKTETDCVRCGEAFEYYPSDKPGIYCSGCIRKGTGLDRLGPTRAGPRVELNCEQCGNAFEALRSRVGRRPTRFCSIGCHGEWIAENYNGENHHAWKSGRTEYASGWLRARRLTLERDDYTCQRCGVSRIELDANPHVHHVVPVRTFDEPADAHELTNLVTLCASCHPKVEHGVAELPEGPWTGR